MIDNKLGLKQRHGFLPIFRLRYRLDFNNRASIFGHWNRPEQDFSKQLWAIKKHGLTRVSIEGERNHKWTVHTLLEVDGHEYASMRWVNVMSIGGWNSGKWAGQGDIVGLTILTNDKAASVFIDGSTDLRSLNEYEKKFKLKEHSV